MMRLKEERQMKWISVEDGFPEYKKLVLLACGQDYVCVGCRYSTDEKGEHFRNQNGCELENVTKVTHWLVKPALLGRG